MPWRWGWRRGGGLKELCWWEGEAPAGRGVRPAALDGQVAGDEAAAKKKKLHRERLPWPVSLCKVRSKNILSLTLLPAASPTHAAAPSRRLSVWGRRTPLPPLECLQNELVEGQLFDGRRPPPSWRALPHHFPAATAGPTVTARIIIDVFLCRVSAGADHVLVDSPQGGQLLLGVADKKGVGRRCVAVAAAVAAGRHARYGRDVQRRGGRLLPGSGAVKRFVARSAAATEARGRRGGGRRRQGRWGCIVGTTAAAAGTALWGTAPEGGGGGKRPGGAPVGCPAGWAAVGAGRTR